MAFDHSENFFSDGRDPRRLASRTELEHEIEAQDSHELKRQRAEFLAMQRRHRQEMDDLVAQRSSMFGRTPPEVSVNALSLAIEEAHHQAKLRAASGQADERVRDIRLFQAQIQGREVAFHVEGRSGKPSFIDDGKNIFVPDYNDDIALLASLQLAQMRWGIIKVTGAADFKERIVQLAAEHDLKLSNEDLARRVHQRRSSTGTLSAPTPQELKAAQKLHDELDAGSDPVEPRAPISAPKPSALPLVAPDDEDAVIEEETPAPEAKARDAGPAGAAPAATDAPGGTADEKAWIAQLQEERRRKAEERAVAATKSVVGGSMPKREYDEALDEEVSQLKRQPAMAGGVSDDDLPEEAIEIDEPDHEIDLGYGEDEEDGFSMDLPAASIPGPAAKKTAGVAARP